MHVIAALAPDTTPPWAWGVFAVIVILALMVDLLIVNRRAHAQTARQAGSWVAVWISLAIAFNVLVYFVKGHGHALEFSTAYLIELSLSVDNLFIFLVVFKFFGVKPEYQHRTLFWGILGAVIMRGVLIGLGVELLKRFAWLVFIFGAILIVTGIKLFFSREGSYDPSKMFAYRMAKRYVPLTDKHHGEHFFTIENGRRLATPLFMVLIVIEATDLVFAVDSIPACLAVSRDAFVVYSSNIFAILGLRSLYFLLSGAMGALRFLKPALSLVLVFIGTKMMLAEIEGTSVQAPHPYKIPTTVSLIVVAGILGSAVLASLLFPAKKASAEPTAPEKADAADPPGTNA